jgi:hypothetical protein
MTLESIAVSHSPEDVLAALDLGEPERLLGMEETPQIDFKREPYLLQTPKGKWELGKDVAGFSNYSYGVLVLGVGTKKTPGNFLELADDLCPIPVSMLDKDQYRDIIRDIVRPAVDFTISFYPHPGQPDKGYMTISVQPLPQYDRWALVRRVLTDEGKLADGIGVPIRDGDQTRWLSADEVYLLIRDGQRSSTLGGGVPTTATGIVTFEESTGTVDPAEAANRLISFKDWQDPVLIWQSVPRKPEDLVTRMWGKDGIADSLRNSPPLRSSGFNWHVWTDPEPFEDGALLSDGRKALWIQENGLATAAAVVHDEMLAWATRTPPASPYRLNLIALTELTLEYFRLTDQILAPCLATPYRHAIDTRSFTGERGVTLSTALPPFIGGMQYPAKQDRRREFTATDNVERDSYQALSRLFGNFSLGPERVPFADNGRIDSEAFLDYVGTQ